MPPRDPDERPSGDEIDLRSVRGGGPPAEARAPEDDDLGRIGEIVRSLSADDLARDEPPPGVWQGIVARTGGAAVGGGPAADDGPDEVSDPVPGHVQPPSPPPLRSVEGGGAAGREQAPVHGSPPMARRRRTWGLVAAAAAVIVLVVGGVALARRDESGSVVASAELEPLPDEPTGSAVPVRADLIDKGGSLQLDLSTGELAAPAGYYEVWLIDTEISGMVSLGPARADGTYAVPPDVDPAAFPIVDVSLEPPDGDPTHSGVSVLRGTLA